MTPENKSPTETSPCVWPKKQGKCVQTGPLVVSKAEAGPTDDTMGTESQPSTPVNEQEKGQVAVQTEPPPTTESYRNTTDPGASAATIATAATSAATATAAAVASLPRSAQRGSCDSKTAREALGPVLVVPAPRASMMTALLKTVKNVKAPEAAPAVTETWAGAPTRREPPSTVTSSSEYSGNSLSGASHQRMDPPSGPPQQASRRSNRPRSPQTPQKRNRSKSSGSESAVRDPKMSKLAAHAANQLVVFLCAEKQAALDDCQALQEQRHLLEESNKCLVC